MLASSWRDAAVLEEYRDGSFEKWRESQVSSGAKASVENDVEDWDDETVVFRKRNNAEDAVVGEVSKNHVQSPILDEPSAKSSDQKADPAITDVEYDENDLIKTIENQLSEAILKRKVDDSIELFEVATVQHGLDISMGIVEELFRLLSNHRPFHTYQLLQYIIQRTNINVFPARHDANQELSEAESEKIGRLYQRMCYSLKLLDPAHNRHGDIRSLVDSVVTELGQLDEHVERLCLPVLVTSLAEQRAANIGGWALHYYHRMAENNYELRPEYFMHLLTCSKFNRQNDLPYHDVLRQVVRFGLRPLPHIVMNAVENMFPYTENVEGTSIALQSVMELQRGTQQLSGEQQQQIAEAEAQLLQEKNPATIKQLKHQLARFRRPHSYTIDIATLEAMGVAGSRTGCVELVLLLWDALDMMGYEPTESLYESTIVCFAGDNNLCENAFVVLKDMEDRGLVPSRALIKSFSLALR
jgi:hypothetical protein